MRITNTQTAVPSFKEVFRDFVLDAVWSIEPGVSHSIGDESALVEAVFRALSAEVANVERPATRKRQSP